MFIYEMQTTDFDEMQTTDFDEIDRYSAIVFADNIELACKYLRERLGRFIHVKTTTKLGVVSADVHDQFNPGVHCVWRW